MLTTAIATDFHQWALDTATAIREGRFDGIDWEQVADEIEDLAKRERHELQSRLTQLMYHLLKIQFQPERHGRSWDLSVCNQRRAIVEMLEDQPSLKPVLQDEKFLRRAYRDALSESAKENLPDSVVLQFPEECPYSLADLLPLGG